MRFLTRRMPATAGVAALAASTVLLGTAACGAGAEAPAKAQSGVSTPTVTVTGARIDVRTQMRALEAKYESRIGAFAFDTATGKSVGYREQERFPFASSFKVFAAAALLDKARRTDPDLMNRVVHWKASDILENSPVTEKKENIENGLTYARLCHAAITVSDNTAANLVLDELGGPAALTRFFRSLGDPLSRLDDKEPELNAWNPKSKRNITRPVLAARDLKAITVGRGLTAADRATVTNWLKDSVTAPGRIKAGLPAGWTLGHKTGTAGANNYGAASDIAIAWSPTSKAPVVIAVYTNRWVNGRENDDAAIRDTAAAFIKALGRS